MKMPAIHSRPPGAREGAFTMVEIALCLALIGFAFVAIIGVLPKGMKVQQENREETIINQDAGVWLSSLRDGARGYDDLTNYVDAVVKVVTEFDDDGNIRSGFPRVHVLTPTNYLIDGAAQAPVFPNNHFFGSNIVGLLSTPKYGYRNAALQLVSQSNYVVAYVRAMSGAASEKFPQQDADVRDLAFRYRMVAEVVPFAGWDTNWVTYGDPGLPPDEMVARSNYWKVAANTFANAYDMRLLFRWPLLPQGGSGNGRQVFRVSAGGDLLRTNDVAYVNMPLYFLTPRTYVHHP